MSDLKMPDLNYVVIAGRLTRDPELKYTGSNRPLCNVSIAHSRKYKVDGDVREEVVFIEGTVWDKAAEWCARYTKGTPVVAQGRLRQSEWADREGNKRTRLELNIQRLQSLTWDQKTEAGAAHANMGEPVNDDIPF